MDAGRAVRISTTQMKSNRARSRAVFLSTTETLAVLRVARERCVRDWAMVSWLIGTGCEQAKSVT